MLFSKVVATLSTNPPISLLYLLAAAALGQICFGALCGRMLSPLVDGSYDKSRKILGWHPLNPPASAAAIADGTARAAGIPAAAAALLPRQSSSSSLKGGNYSSSGVGSSKINGMKDLATVSCAFGNSFTLPAVFFLTLLPSAAASKALGYAALFLLTWSPCLWSFGLSLVHGTVGLSSSSSSSSSSSPSVDGRTTTAALSSLNNNDNNNNKKRREQVITTLKTFFQKTFNPPVVSILLGMLVASTPLGASLFLSSRSSAAIDNLPGVFSSALKAIVEVISMMSEGTLPLQTLVLAASLLQKPEQQQQQQQEVELVNTKGETILAMNATTTTTTTTNNNVKSNKFSLLLSFSPAITTIKLLLLPSCGEEARALAIISLTRFLLLPLATATALFWATRLGWLGPAGVDPVLLFVILVQSVMPSAQNLIIVLQLSDQTRSSAPAYAKMLLKLYAAAIVPVTLWVTAFASNLKIPLA